VAEALGEGKPVGLIVSTPAFCQVSICGPVLDLVIDAAAEFPDIRLIHAEVYADPYTTLATFSPTIVALGLPFEPALVLAGADGKVEQRLDSIFDSDELRQAFTRLTA
jgi:hypothetical protein